jgi:hypothetical protein
MDYFLSLLMIILSSCLKETDNKAKLLNFLKQHFAIGNITIPNLNGYTDLNDLFNQLGNPINDYSIKNRIIFTLMH